MKKKPKTRAKTIILTKAKIKKFKNKTIPRVKFKIKTRSWKEMTADKEKEKY